MQTFYLAALYEEFPVTYQGQIMLDYFNPHTALAHQLTDVFQRMALYFISLGNAVAALTSAVSLELAQALLDVVIQTFNLAFCFTLEIEGGSPDTDYTNDFLNAFQIPFNLIRFRFPFGTVFNVVIESWNLGNLQTGGLPGNPETDPPFDTTNPNELSPFPTPGGNNPEAPYGDSPPESSPLDPTLDPDDFSNAPEPPPEPDTILLQSWFIPGIPGQQSEGVAVGCPAGSLAESIPSLSGVQNSTSQGTFPVRIDEDGVICAQDVLAGAPGFTFSDNVFSAAGCGVNGLKDC